MSAVWPCGFTTPAQQAIAAEYFLSTRGYNIDQLEDASPSNFMNLKSFNSHEHVPFPPGDLRLIADAAETQRKWANLVLHALTNDDGAIAHAATRDLWVAPIGSIVKYIMQRDRTVIGDYSETSSALAFTFWRLAVAGTAQRDFESAFKATDVVTLRVALAPTRYANAVTVDGSPVAFEVRQEADGRYLYFSAPVSATSRTAAVSLTSAVPPILDVSAEGFDLTITVGDSVPAQTLTITNVGGGTLTWNAAITGGGTPWLSVSPTSGSAPASVALAVDASGLGPGTYQRTIDIVSAGAVNSPVSVPVTLRVLPAGTEQFVLDYPDRASLLAAGWDFLARTAGGGGRNTEQTSGAVVSYSGGGLQIPPDHGDLWAGLNDTRNSLFRDLPSNWASVRVALNFAPTQTPQQAGLVVYDHDDHYVHVTRIFNGSPLVAFARETGGVAAVLNTASVTTSQVSLRRDRNVTTGVITALHSADGGSTWASLGDVTQTLRGRAWGSSLAPRRAGSRWLWCNRCRCARRRRPESAANQHWLGSRDGGWSAAFSLRPAWIPWAPTAFTGNAGWTSAAGCHGGVKDV